MPDDDATDCGPRLLHVCVVRPNLTECRLSTGSVRLDRKNGGYRAYLQAWKAGDSTSVVQAADEALPDEDAAGAEDVVVLVEDDSEDAAGLFAEVVSLELDLLESDSAFGADAVRAPLVRLSVA